MVDTKKMIAELLSGVLELDPEQTRSLIEKPPNSDFGDFAVPCFGFAKKLRKDPKMIASDFAARVKPGGLIEKAEPRGPYLNIFLDRSRFIEEVIADLTGTGFDRPLAGGDGKTVIIDYSSPNIAKPFGIGHLRSTVIGNSLKRIFAYLGYRTIGINHIGDWGTQFGKLITAYKLWGDEKKLVHDPIRYLYDLYVRLHREAEKDPSLEDDARQWFSRLEKQDPEALELWQRFRDLSIEDFKRIYGRLGVSFEHYTGESFYSNLLDETVEEVKKSGITQRSEGALIVPLEDMPPALITKKDGSTLYLTRDIAAVLYRKKSYNFDMILYVVGSPQALHFRQLFGVLERMGNDWVSRCHHIPFGQIRFSHGAMSTRKGNIIFLEEVMDKAVSLARDIIEEKNPGLTNREEIAEAIGVGSIIFNDLKNSRIKDITFDWDEILNFNGETGVYLQYTHARIGSLLKKLEQKYGALEPFSELKFGECQFGDEGYEIVGLLNDFEKTVRRAGKEFEPSVISRYLLDVAKAFNTFYNSCRVITEDELVSRSRGLIVLCCRKVLRQGLELLGISAIEEM
ncbi:MAG TPA: arginine--tRNA ligase [Spirochaetota bacterium]|nr:arginine--tRNA ligase [Spirochaetota bacterium]